MASFDIVNKIDIQEVYNAIANSLKEIKQRYDFKGSVSNLKVENNFVVAETEDTLKAKQINEILIGHLVKRNVNPKCLAFEKTEKATGNTIRQYYRLIEGIDRTISKKITVNIKSTKLKVQARIQGDELRITGSKKDELQRRSKFLCR